MSEHRGPAAFYALRQIGSAALDGVALMRVVAIGAAHFAFEHRMMMWELKRGAHFRVTCEAGIRRFARIDNEDVAATAGFHVQAARSVAAFATHALGVVALRFQARMRRRPKISHDGFVTRRAFFGADKFRPRNARRRHDGVVRFETTAGKKDDSE